MLFKVRSNDRFVCYDYSGIFAGDIKAIANWVCDIVNNSSLDIKSITLKDLKNNFDECNQSIQIKKPLDKNILVNEILHREIDLISFDGFYELIPLSVSINICDDLLSIGYNKKYSLIIDEIERIMNLNSEDNFDKEISDNKQFITSYNNIDLINKYNKFYIRFLGGQHEEMYCDLLITNDEANEIIDNPEKIKNIRDDYKKKIDWTRSYFVDSYLKDFMKYECGMSNKNISSNMDKLDRHQDIKRELYETVFYRKHPYSAEIKICGYSAKQLYEETYLSVLGAYNYLIYLRDEPQKAIADLKAGLPKK